MKLAVRKEQGAIPGGGFHYMLHIEPMPTAVEAAIFDKMGYIVVDVSDETGARLLEQARAALLHQVEIAVLADAAERQQ